MPMTIDAAVADVRETFPQPRYLHGDRERAWRTIADRVARYVKPGGSVLDFGSGPCDAASVVALMGYEVHAGDDLMDTWHLLPGMREKIAAFAARHGVKFELLESTGPLPWGEQRFDMVMLHHVLEHIPESPKDLMTAIVSCAKDEGYVFVTVPSAVNIRKRLDVLRGRTNYPPYDQFYWYPPPWRGHRREYCRDDLVRLCRNLGLRQVELTTYHAMLLRIPPAARPLYKAATAVVPGWRDSWLLIAQRPRGWKRPTEPPAGSKVMASLHMTGELN